MMTPTHAALQTKPPMVAVVDDDRAVSNSLKFSLELEGFEVEAFGGGAELLGARDIGSFDCFVVDQRMPGMSGLELIASLRAGQVAAPAILVVSQPNAAVSARAAKMRVPIVEKPFPGDTLVDAIRRACRRG